MAACGHWVVDADGCSLRQRCWSRRWGAVVIGAHRAAALKAGNAGRVPLFVRRDCSAELEEIVTRGGFVLVVASRAELERATHHVADDRIAVGSDRAGRPRRLRHDLVGQTELREYSVRADLRTP